MFWQKKAKVYTLGDIMAAIDELKTALSSAQISVNAAIAELQRVETLVTPNDDADVSSVAASVVELSNALNTAISASQSAHPVV